LYGAVSDPRITFRSVLRIAQGRGDRVEDSIAVEGALEMRIDGRALAVTLRTPGHDRELALGFLAGESLIRGRDQVASIREFPADCADQPDAVEIELAPGVPLDWTRLERHFASTSACGLCGRAHLESLRAGLVPMTIERPIEARAIAALPGRLRTEQTAFAATGGLHAAAWCDADLEVQVLREDVGRHNAVDKVAGWLLERGRYSVGRGILWISGRAGAEIALKAARARIPVLAAVGAPSSMAVEIAVAAGLTLVGFLREDRMNVYSSPERLAL
jgi:FdhD protein